MTELSLEPFVKMLSELDLDSLVVKNNNTVGDGESFSGFVWLEGSNFELHYHFMKGPKFKSPYTNGMVFKVVLEYKHGEIEFSRRHLDDEVIERLMAFAVKLPLTGKFEF